MIYLDPNITKDAYPSGNPFWLVSCTLPDGERYRKKHRSENKAQVDRVRLIRKYHGGGIDEDTMKLAEMAMHKLENTENPDARGKDILTAVEWFTQNYQEKAFELVLGEYVEDFYERKRAKRNEKTVEEIEYYLDQVKEIFGTRKPSEVSWQEWKKYLDANNSYYHRYKVLSHFLGWLADDAKDISKLENPPLESNPLKHIERPKQSKGRPKICTVEEVKATIKKALELECVTWFVWGFNTGMRPEAEMKPFWKDPEFGWRFVDFDERKIVVSEEIEKTGKRTREITIQPNLLEWLKLFKANPNDFPMYPANLVRKFNWVKFGKKNKKGKLASKPALSVDKARESDIMRHTFISNLSRIEPIGEVCYQCATSIPMIRRHYKVLIPDKKKVKAFFNIRPKDFGFANLSI